MVAWLNKVWEKHLPPAVIKWLVWDSSQTINTCKTRQNKQGNILSALNNWHHKLVIPERRETEKVRSRSIIAQSGDNFLTLQRKLESKQVLTVLFSSGSKHHSLGSWGGWNLHVAYVAELKKELCSGGPKELIQKLHISMLEKKKQTNKKKQLGIKI